jgi:hypothetical protein
MIKKYKTKIFLGSMMLLSVSLNAQDWEVKNFALHMENDADFRTDRAYTYGADISVLFKRESDSWLHIPFTDYKGKDHYISFSYAHQIYTPEDLTREDVIEDDRPYAGYMYLQSGIYQAGDDNLKSLIFQVGLVGPSTHMESVQEMIHSLIGSDDPQGWDNQLGDELILQINYSDKYYFKMDDIFGLEANLVPEWGFDLGNASTKLYTAVLYRFGWDIAKDYGSYAIDNTSYSKIPLRSDASYPERWSFAFNLSAKGNLIARNIFLDGNTIRESHSVDKNYATLNIGYGISASYGHFSIDYLRTHTSKEFKDQEDLNSYGSLLFSYNY